MVKSREQPSLPIAEYRSESAAGTVGVHVDPRLFCLAVAFSALGCIDGTQGIQAESGEDNPYSIVYQPESKGDFAHVNAIVVKGNAIDVFLAVPEGYEGEQINASVTLLRDGNVVESGLREVKPGENPFSFAFKANPEPGDTVAVSLEGSPTFVVTVAGDESGPGEMPDMPR